MKLELSRRDVLSLALFALTEIDDRICESENRRRNSINFSGCLLESNNTGYLASHIEEKFAGQDEDELLDFAIAQLNLLKSEAHINVILDTRDEEPASPE